MITDHRHAPSKHNSSADNRLRPRLPVCLPASAAPGCRTPKKYIYTYKHRAGRRCSLKPHGGSKRRLTSSRVSSNHLSVPRIQWKASLPKVSFTASQRNEFDCDKRSLKNMRVYATARASVPAVRSIWGQVGWQRWWWWYGLWGGEGVYPSALHSLTRCLRSLSVLLLFLNTDPYLPTAQELSRLTSLTLTQARIKSGLFTQQPRLY